MHRFALQSAMEYLMTYGWAILIIAVVLGALFGLGFFNSANLAPKVKAGACQVYRPNGPGTTDLINTVGTCNNELPQYVAKFNGNNAYMTLGNAGMMSPEAGSSGAMTLCVWYDTLQSNPPYFVYKGENAPSSGNTYEYAISSTQFAVWTSSGALIAVATSPPVASTNTWHFGCFTYNYASSSADYYLDGTQYAATFTSGTASTAGSGQVALGASGSPTTYANVEISNVQIYNASLSANEISALYHEGVGGIPINLNSLVGWWPLNGDAKDYSGNINDGTPTNVIYTSSWTAGYSAP